MMLPLKRFAPTLERHAQSDSLGAGAILEKLGAQFNPESGANQDPNMWLISVDDVGTFSSLDVALSAKRPSEHFVPASLQRDPEVLAAYHELRLLCEAG